MSTPSPEEISSAFRDYSAGLDGLAKLTTNATVSMGKVTHTTQSFGQKMKDAGKNIGSAIKSDIVGIASGSSTGLQSYTKSATAFADGFADIVSSLGIFGKILGGVVKAGAEIANQVAKHGDAMYGGYQQMAKLGATNAQGMKGTIDNLHKMNFTMKDLGTLINIISENATSLAQYGGSVTSGVQDLTNLTDGLKKTGVSTKFREMGWTYEDIARASAANMQIIRLSGYSKRMTDEELAIATENYLKETDRLTKLTGQTAEEQKNLEEDALTEERYATKVFQLAQKKDDAKAQAQLKTLRSVHKQLAPLGGDLRRAVVKAAAGQIDDEDVKRLARSAPNALRMLQTGEGDDVAFMEMLQKELKQTAKDNNQLAQAGQNNKQFISYSEITAMQGMKSAQARNKSALKEQKVTDAAAKNMVALEDNQRKLTVSYEDMLTKGVEPMAKAFSKASGFLNGFGIKIGKYTPVKMPTSFAGAAGGPSAGGPPAATGGVSGGIGALAEKFETGGKGSSVIGWDSTGGTSYGKYQIAAKTGAMTDFLKFLKTNNPAAYSQLVGAGNPDGGKTGPFAQVWIKLAQSGVLGDSEEQFIKTRSYDVTIGKIKDPALRKMIESNKALQQMVFSTSVQHGAGGAASILNSVWRPGMSAQELVQAVYASRSTKFGSSTAAVRASVQKRFIAEQAMVMGALSSEGGVAGTAAPSTPQGAGAPVGPGQPTGPAAQGSLTPELSPIKTASGKSVQVNKAAAPAFQNIINWLESSGYKIYSIGGYVNRQNVNDPSKKSAHAYGGAIDINPDKNPNGSRLITDMPGNVGQAAASFGLGWGGNWKSVKDAMHFSAMTREGGKILKFAKGGVASGPKSGYQVELHGTEAVVPVGAQGSIPVESTGGDSTSAVQKRAELLRERVRLTNVLISEYKKIVNNTEKQMKLQG